MISSIYCKALTLMKLRNIQYEINIMKKYIIYNKKV